MAVRALVPAATAAALVEQLELLEQGRQAMAAAQLEIMLALERLRRDEQQVPQDKAPAGVCAEIGLATRAGVGTASHRLGLARVLHRDLPRTQLLLAGGRISEQVAAKIASAARCLSRADRLRLDQQVADRLEGLGPQAASSLARAVAYELDPAVAVAAAARAAEDRYVASRPMPDCMVQVTALLPVAQGVAVVAALRRAAESARAAGDPRSLTQLMADVLVERVTGRSPADLPVEVGLIMTDRSLLQGDDAPAVIPGYGSVPAGVARSLLDRGDRGEGSSDDQAAARVFLRRLYTDPQTGELAAMDARRRFFTGTVRRLVVWRDQHCRFPWCDAPIRHVDHTTPYARGGSTTPASAVGLCEAHNLAVEAAGFRRTRDVHGDFVVTAPTGRRHRTRPRPAGSARRADSGYLVAASSRRA